MENPKYPTIDNFVIHTKGVEKLFQKHRINKASGLDELRAYILRETATKLDPLLTAICNQPLTSRLRTGT